MVIIHHSGQLKRNINLLTATFTFTPIGLKPVGALIF